MSKTEELAFYKCAPCQVEWRSKKKKRDNCWVCNEVCDASVTLSVVKKNPFENWGYPVV